MTIHCELFVGCRSVVRLTWQDPPPWTALPMKLRVWGWPMVIVFEAPSASYTPDRCLHGKSLPSAISGELVRVDLPYGVGLNMSMWALTEAMQSRSAAAMALKESLVEAILCEGWVRRFEIVRQQG
jgi:hypothetical protein